MSAAPASRRQYYVLGVLLAGLVALMLWQFRGSSTTDPAAGTPAPSNEGGRTNASGAGRGAAMPVVDVKLEALQREGQGLPESARNPFRFQDKAPPPAPPPVAQQEAPRPQPGAQAAAGPPPLPPIQLRYIGLLGSPTQPDRIAVLSDPRGEPIYGKEGDIIEGRYRVLRISGDSVDVAYADGRGRQTLRLSVQ